jgi:hypothetical protein
MEKMGELEKLIIGFIIIIGGGYLLIEADVGILGVIGLVFVLVLAIRD